MSSPFSSGGRAVCTCTVAAARPETCFEGVRAARGSGGNQIPQFRREGHQIRRGPPITLSDNKICSDNGKPAERRRRKATGLHPFPGHGRRAAEGTVRSESAAPIRCGFGGFRMLRPLDGEIACAVSSRLRPVRPRLPPRRFRHVSPRCRTCGGPSVPKRALTRTKRTGVTPPQPLTLTLVTPVSAPLVHLVRATDRCVRLCGRNPRSASTVSPGRAAGTCTPCALAANRWAPRGPARRLPLQHRTEAPSPEA